MKHLFQKNTGITLIALVITIIVLLILAGVTIASLTGENGLLSRAANARDDTRGSTVKERVALEATNNSVVTYTGGTKKTRVALINELYEEGLLTENEVNILTDEDNPTDIITIGSIKIDFSVLGTSRVPTIGSEYEDNWIGKKIEYTANGENNWIILGKDNNGNILITTESPVNSFTRYHTLADWCDYEEDLHQLCSVYAGTIGANNIPVIEARSITMEDVQLCLGVTIPETFDTYTFTTESGENNVNYYYPDEVNKTWVAPSSTNTWSHDNDSYSFDIFSYTPATDEYEIGYNSSKYRDSIKVEAEHPKNYDLLNIGQYWIASRFVGFYPGNYVEYYAASSNINGLGLDFLNKYNTKFAESRTDGGYDAYDYDAPFPEDMTYSVRPVVVLSSEIPYDDVEIQN